VIDEPTAVLVERLHAALGEGNVSRAEALRRAQLAMIMAGVGRRRDAAGCGPAMRSASPSYAHPFFWAFTLIGDGGAPL
jgi:CHAT domain-containing protein